MNRALTVDNGLFDDAVKFASGGAGAAGGIYTFRWFLQWISGRHDRREELINAKDTAVDERWAKYTKTMEARVDKLEAARDRLEAEVEDCHAHKRELENRVARLEGFSHGLGDLRQEAQVAISLDHAIKGGAA